MRFRSLGAVCATCAAAAPSPAYAAEPITPAAPSPLANPAAAPPELVAAATTGTPPPTAAAAARSSFKLRLVERNVSLKQRHLKLLGERLDRSERRDRRDILQQLSAPRVARKNVSLRHDIRDLRERITGGGAPDVPIPPQLAAIAQCESGGNTRATSASGTYRGKYQFSFQTWGTVGGKGDPAQASETEQDRRAAMLYRREGPGQWPVCGR